MYSWIASTPMLSARRLAPAAVTTLFLMFAVLGGIVIGSGNLVLMAIVLGALLGGLLLGSIGIVVWVLVVSILLVSGPLLMHFPEARRLPWLFSMLGFLLAGASTLYIGSAHGQQRREAPVFVGLALAFICFVIINTFLGEGALEEKLTAIKRWFQFWGVLFIFAVAPFTTRQVGRWVWGIFLIALVQLPFALHQRIMLVPQRMNMPDRVVPIDIVTGTLEADMWGAGNNNTMSYFLIVAAVGVLSAYRDGAISTMRMLLILALLVIPLGLGETKMVLVFLPIAFLAAYGDMVRRRPALFGLASIAAAGIIAMFAFIYVGLNDSDGRSMTIQGRISENIEYNFGTTGYHGGGSLNRSTVVPFWWRQHGLDNPVETVFGHGVGASFASETDPGHIERRYPGYSVGLTGLSMLLWDVGVLGTGLYLAILLLAGLTAIRLLRRAAPGMDRAICRALVASVFLQLILVPATDIMFLAPSTEFLQALTLGLIAWRWRSTQPVSDRRLDGLSRNGSPA